MNEIWTNNGFDARLDFFKEVLYQDDQITTGILDIDLINKFEGWSLFTPVQIAAAKMNKEITLDNL